MSAGSTIKLKTLGENGAVPATRLESARATIEIVDQLIDANEKRCRTDALVKGMVDGNRPYRQADLDANAQSWRCNENWRIAESFLNIALSAYWDIVSESPSKATVTTEWGESSGQSQHWSGIITEEFERLNMRDSSLNNMFRDSQHDMVLFRMGPVMWPDAFDYRAETVKCAHLLTLDKTKSDINKWKLAVVRATYSADDLYAFIRNPQSASKSGWNVRQAKRILMDAVPVEQYPNKKQNWEFYQQQIRNNDIYWSTQSEAINVAHVYVREFVKPGEPEGRISHFIVQEEGTEDEYLFQRIGRYANWRQVMCPFYYDTGDGEHHSVKGLGIKMHGALDRINRLMCHEVDISFIGSSINFQCQTAADKEKIQLTQMGPVNVWDQGITLLPTAAAMAQLIAAPSTTRQQLLSTVTANLAQYRQGMEREKGNPVSAREISYRAENQSFLGRAGVTYYFDQLDDFYAERFRRAANPNLTEGRPGAIEALRFQERCRKRGVPKEALQNVSVRATRTVGYGSPDARLQSLMRILSRLGLYSEEGRQKILFDATASDVGTELARKYMPELENTPTPSIAFQRKQAQQDVALLRLNIMPLVTPDSNALIYAETFILAGSQALEGVTQQVGNPMEIVQFVDNCGQAALMHLQRIKDDPTRKEAYDAMIEQLQEMASANDQLAQQIQQQMQRNGQQVQKTQQFLTDQEMKEQENAAGISRKERKLQVDLAAKEAKTRQSLAIADLTTAQELRHNRLKELNGESE